MNRNRDLTIRSLAALLALAAAPGCVAPALQPAPKLDAAPTYAVQPDPLGDQRFTHTLQPLDDAKTVLYLQSFGGGGAGVGLLLGPLGVAANAKAIGANTDADVKLLAGKLPLRPADTYQDVLRELPELAAAAPGAGAVRLTPEVLIVRAKDEVLLFGCTLGVDYTGVGTKWSRTYVYQTGISIPKAQVAQGLAPEQLQALQAELRTGFQTLTALYLDDLHGKAEPVRSVKFKSVYMSPRFTFELVGQELPGPADRRVVRLVLRNGGAITYSFPQAAVEVN
jgi:hypothetical protein